VRKEVAKGQMSLPCSAIELFKESQGSKFELGLSDGYEEKARMYLS
jgi:hypothetical protein